MTVLADWPGPLAVADPAVVSELRSVLLAGGFDGRTVRQAIGAEGPVLARPGDAPVLRRRPAGREPLATFAALFLLDLELPLAAVRRAFAPLALERLAQLGLVECGSGRVRACVRLVPHDDLLIASDTTGAEGPAHVPGVHNPSLTLAQLTVRRRVAAALDVGTGCGIQAILASRHSGRVVATDVNERALNFAAFNAILNGAENIELRAGSYLEPVAGERFDIVTCNPPYVISPETAFVYRDGGLAGDSVSRNVVQAVPEALEEGGYATVLVSWMHPPGEAWPERLREWVPASGSDALLLHYQTQDPLTHAASWTRDDPESVDAALERWLGYLDGLGIEGIAYGAVVLRRRDAPEHHVLAHELPKAGLRAAGAHIERLFAAADHLAGVSDEALLGERLALTEHARVEQRVTLRAGTWAIDDITLSLDEGLGFDVPLAPAAAHLLAALDASCTLAEVVEALAKAHGVDAPALTPDAVQLARELLARAFLERAT